MQRELSAQLTEGLSVPRFPGSLLLCPFPLVIVSPPFVADIARTRGTVSSCRARSVLRRYDHAASLALPLRDQVRRAKTVSLPLFLYRLRIGLPGLFAPSSGPHRLVIKLTGRHSSLEPLQIGHPDGNKSAVAHALHVSRTGDIVQLTPFVVFHVLSEKTQLFLGTAPGTSSA